MPKITLIGVGTSYSMRVGRKMWDFTGGRSRQVPENVALAAQKKKSHGKAMFNIEKVKAKDSEQNVKAVTGQVRLAL